ncbi:MAG: methyltransferase domain-containing protein [Myxococcota bacterium]
MIPWMWAATAGAHEPEHDHATVQHRFDDAAKWAAVFDDPARDAWQKPAELVAALEITPGSTVADLGAGTGYFEPHLARAVGPDGVVLAIDIEPNLIAHLTERAATEQTPGVRPRLTDPSSAGLERKEADLVLIVDTYHHIDAREDYFRAARAGVARGGRLVVVDFRTEVEIPVGPPPEHRLAPERVRSELEAAGWTYDASLDLLPYQYVLVFRR